MKVDRLFEFESSDFATLSARAGGEAARELIVVENWFEELKAKVGN